MVEDIHLVRGLLSQSKADSVVQNLVSAPQVITAPVFAVYFFVKMFVDFGE